MYVDGEGGVTWPLGRGTHRNFGDYGRACEKKGYHTHFNYLKFKVLYAVEGKISSFSG